MQPIKTLAIVAFALSSAMTVTSLPLDTATKDVQTRDNAAPINEGPVDVKVNLEDELHPELEEEVEVEARHETETEIEIDARHWNPFYPCRFWWCR